MFSTGDNPIFGASNTILEIDDETAGPFVKVTQLYDDEREHIIKLYPEELDEFIDLLKRLKEIAERNYESFL
jgi:hypothetical protein